jgi:anaerobic ribonucleoside-triphosphate reductase activating protein
MNIATTQYTLQNMMFEIYVSGCKEHPCKGCFTPELWDENVGELLDEKKYEELKIRIERDSDMIENLMICGGEILEKPIEDVLELITFLQQFEKPIWLFTRFEKKDVPKEILDEIDYIKCGMYDKTKRTGDNVHYGIRLASSNQKIYKVK